MLRNKTSLFILQNKVDERLNENKDCKLHFPCQIVLSEERLFTSPKIYVTLINVHGAFIQILNINYYSHTFLEDIMHRCNTNKFLVFVKSTKKNTFFQTH